MSQRSHTRRRSVSALSGRPENAPKTELAVDLRPERDYAVNIVNAPVFDHTGHVTLVLSLTGFGRALRGTEVQAAGDALLAATRVITDALSPTPSRTSRG